MPSGKPIRLLVLCVLTALLGILGAGAAPAAPDQRADKAIRSLFGLALVRAEIVTVSGTKLVDNRVNRGTIRSIRPRKLMLSERDGRLVRIPISSGTRVTLDGRKVKVSKLRRGMRATTLQKGNARALWVDARKRSADRSLSKIKALLDKGLVRTEVISSSGGSVLDRRIDTGSIASADTSFLSLSERDGTTVDMEIDAAAEIWIDNRPGNATELSAGMEATTIRIGDAATSRIWASSSSARPKDKNKDKGKNKDKN